MKKLKLNGQFLLLMTNALLLVAILANYSLAKNANHEPNYDLKTSSDVAIKKEKTVTPNNVLTEKEDNRPSPTSTTFGEPIIGEIAMFGGNFAPRSWALCNGQLLTINQHQALFSILGTTYGGDGRTTFGLPDLRGRVPIHAGQGPGLDNVRLGQQSNVGFMMPYFDDKYNPVLPPATQAVNYIIALQGIFPSRN